MNDRLIQLRPSRQVRVGAHIPLLFSFGLLAVAVWFAFFSKEQGIDSIYCLFVPGFWSIFALFNWHKSRWIGRAWITMDDGVMQGCTYDQPLFLPWKEVVVAYLDERAQAVVIGSEDQLHIFPLSLWGRPLWEAFKEHVPSAALEAAAYQRLPGYKAAVANYEQLLADPFLCISHRSFPSFVVLPLGFSVIVLSAFIVDGLDMDGLAGAMVYLIFALLTGLIALMTYERVEVTNQCIVVRRFWWLYELRWDDVERIESDPLGMRLVWYGKDKRLVTAGINRWQAQSQDTLIAIIEAQMRHRNIPWQEKSNAFAWSYDRSGRKGV